MNNRTPDARPLPLPVAAKPVFVKIRNLISTGRAVEALPCMAELDEFGRDYPTAVKFTKGMLLIDIADKLDDLDCATKGISLLKDVDVALLPESATPKYWYNLGNGYGARYYINKIPSGLRRALDEDFNQAKRCYRKAMSPGASSPQSTARLYTNYGILLRTVGRHVEEIEAYDEARKAVPDHAMALWHKAKGLRWYSRLVEHPTKASALLEARDLVRKSLEAGLELGHKAKAEKELAELERILKHPEPSTHRPTRHAADSDIETSYVKFCLDNRLYLNECLVSSHEAYQDPLSVRFPTPKKGEYLELRRNDLALIKQEYIAARFLLFAYRCKAPDLSFIDHGTFLPWVEDREGQIYAQFLVLSFRAAYAILDKIGYFLNSFCRLGDKGENVRFQKELFLQKESLREGLRKYDGTQLSALFDLAREFSREQPLYSLRDHRNQLEHRCVTLRRRPTGGEGKTKIEGDAHSRTAVYDLNEDDLYEESLRLLKAVRAAIFYLFNFVRTSTPDPSKELWTETNAGS